MFSFYDCLIRGSPIQSFVFGLGALGLRNYSDYYSSVQAEVEDSKHIEIHFSDCTLLLSWTR